MNVRGNVMNQDKKYELLEHTADAKFRAYGRTREEAFANAVQGMTAIVADPEKLGRGRSLPITVKSKSLQNLLFDFLDEILFLHDTEKFLPALAENLTIVEHEEEFVLEATLHGDDAQKWGGNLKAVTYSDMIVEETHHGWVIQVVIDI
jgi:SHS2 domain-containing protein